MTVQTAPIGRATAAVVFIEPQHAAIARTRGHDRFVVALERRRETDQEFVSRVAREIESCERVVVTGRAADRLALERELVLLTHRPDRLVHDETALHVTRSELLFRLGDLID